MQENMFLQQKGEVSPISKVSAVSSGCSPITQEGKSNKAILEEKKRFIHSLRWKETSEKETQLEKLIENLHENRKS